MQYPKTFFSLSSLFLVAMLVVAGLYVKPASAGVIQATFSYNPYTLSSKEVCGNWRVDAFVASEQGLPNPSVTCQAYQQSLVGISMIQTTRSFNSNTQSSIAVCDNWLPGAGPVSVQYGPNPSVTCQALESVFIGSCELRTANAFVAGTERFPAFGSYNDSKQNMLFARCSSGAIGRMEYSISKFDTQPFTGSRPTITVTPANNGWYTVIYKGLDDPQRKMGLFEGTLTIQGNNGTLASGTWYTMYWPNENQWGFGSRIR